jgi:hypothetical protein
MHCTICWSACLGVLVLYIDCVLCAYKWLPCLFNIIIIIIIIITDVNCKFNGFLTVHHSVDLNFKQHNAQFYLLNNNIKKQHEFHHYALS